MSNNSAVPAGGDFRLVPLLSAEARDAPYPCPVLKPGCNSSAADDAAEYYLDVSASGAWWAACLGIRGIYIDGGADLVPAPRRWGYYVEGVIVCLGERYNSQPWLGTPGNLTPACHACSAFLDLALLREPVYPLASTGHVWNCLGTVARDDRARASRPGRGAPHLLRAERKHVPEPPPPPPPPPQTFHQRCLHTRLEWAGSFDLLVNHTYRWECSPNDGTQSQPRDLLPGLES